MENNELTIQTKEHICTLVLNRAEKGNSLTPEMLFGIHDNLEELAKNDEVRAVVITGAGDRAFCGGYDITALPTSDASAQEATREGRDPFESALQAIVNFPYPVIAMLNGYAFGGGCDLAVSCDIRIGANDIRMGMVPARLGLAYSASGIKRFIQTIGLSKAKEIFFTGRHYNADQAKQIGLLDHLVPRPELESFTYEMAQEIAGNAPLSLKGIKRIMNLISNSQKLSEEDRKEADTIFAKTLFSEDLKEGRLAFIQKRKPLFKGK